MIILALRTDTNRSYLGLYNDYDTLQHCAWDAHRELAGTLYKQLDSLLSSQHMNLTSINGIICYEGPGSFTGLRIGLSAANALGYAYGIPIVTKGGDDWIAQGTDALLNGQNDKIAMPFYGAEANVTQPKK